MDKIKELIDVVLESKLDDIYVTKEIISKSDLEYLKKKRYYNSKDTMYRGGKLPQGGLPPIKGWATATMSSSSPTPLELNDLTDEPEHKEESSSYYMIDLNYLNRNNQNSNNPTPANYVHVYENTISIYDGFVVYRYNDVNQAVEDSVISDLMNEYSEKIEAAVVHCKNRNLDKFLVNTYNNLKLDRMFKIKGIL